MKTYLLIFTIAALLQSSFVPLNLCLILILSRSFVVDDGLNYILAFYGGILLGVLTPINLGFWPIIFLIITKVAQILRKLPFSQNVLTILPIWVVLLLGTSFIESFIFKTSLNNWKVLLEFILIIPTYLVTRFWEERFVVSPGIKLKMRG